MNYFKMFKEIGIIANESNLFDMCYFDIDNNYQKTSNDLFEFIEELYTVNGLKIDLSAFIVELTNLYKEVGFNLGCLFIEKYFNKEFSLNFSDINKLEVKNILDLNGYIDIIFSQIWDIRIKPDIPNLFPGLQNKISLLKHDFIVGTSVPDAVINFVLNSDELSKLLYFIIKSGFKCGLFLWIAYNTLHMHLSGEGGNYLSIDLPSHLI